MNTQLIIQYSVQLILKDGDEGFSPKLFNYYEEAEQYITLQYEEARQRPETDRHREYWLGVSYRIDKRTLLKEPLQTITAENYNANTYFKTRLPEQVNTVDEAKSFLCALIANEEVFHPDDDAHGVCWTGYPPTADQCDHLNKLMYQVANIDGFDPYEYINQKLDL